MEITGGIEFCQAGGILAEPFLVNDRQEIPIGKRVRFERDVLADLSHNDTYYAWTKKMRSDCILVVEDERAVASGLIYGLRDQGFEVLWARDGKSALEMTRGHGPGLIVLDIRLPDISGFDVCRQLRAEGKRQPILMLTARDEEVDKVLGLELGADDYVVKPYSVREVISRVRALLRRAYGELAKSAVEEHSVSFGALKVNFDRMQVMYGDSPVDLTPTEFRLLRYLVRHSERPVSREALIEQVWGYEGNVGNDRTVDVHIRHLRQKLEEDPANPRWLVTVRGAGYMFQP